MEITSALHHTSRQRTSTTAAATQTTNFAPDPAAATYAATASFSAPATAIEFETPAPVIEYETPARFTCPPAPVIERVFFAPDDTYAAPARIDSAPLIKYIAPTSPQVNRDFRSLVNHPAPKIVGSLLPPVSEADQELNVARETTQNIVRSQPVQEQVKVQEVPEVQILERIQEQFMQVFVRIEEQIGDTLVPPTVEETLEPDQQRTVEQTVVSLLFQTLPLVTRASTARGAGVLVVARSFALAIVTMQVKFASSMPMRTPELGDQAVRYIVDSSGLMRSVRVSTLQPTYDESILTTHVGVMSYESVLENLETALKGDVFAMVYKVLLCSH